MNTGTYALKRDASFSVPECPVAQSTCQQSTIQYSWQTLFAMRPLAAALKSSLKQLERLSALKQLGILYYRGVRGGRFKQRPI